MDKQRREYLFRRDGVVEERVIGIKGPTCEQATRAVEQRLGPVVQREYTPEYALVAKARPLPQPDSGAEAKIERDEEAEA